MKAGAGVKSNGTGLCNAKERLTFHDQKVSPKLKPVKMASKMLKLYFAGRGRILILRNWMLP